VALFVYKRLEHTKRVIDALSRNIGAGNTDLVVYSDGPRGKDDEAAVAEVRGYLKNISGFRTTQIVQRESNFGLSRNIISGVSEVVGRQGRVIVVEDDLVTAPGYLAYMNDALEMYAADQSVASVHGYCYPGCDHLPETFFMRGSDCWGWATWERAWKTFEMDGAKLLKRIQENEFQWEFDLRGNYPFTEMLINQIKGKNDSWAIRWHASCFLENMLTLYPRQSLVRNIGMDGSGAHGGNTQEYLVELSSGRVALRRVDLVPCEEAIAAFGAFYGSTRKSIFRRVLNRVGRGLARN
jgi:hypothetical protein